MKTLFREYKQVTRRLLLNAFGAMAVLATGGSRVARAQAPGRKRAPGQWS